MKNLIKKTLLILSLTVFTGCYHTQLIDDDCGTDTNNIIIIDYDCNIELPADSCRWNSEGQDVAVMYYIDDECLLNAESEICEHGCINDGYDVRCLNACENNPCNTPEPTCYTQNIVQFYSTTCILTDDRMQYACVHAESTKKYCGCVEATNDRPAHCWGDYPDEIKEY